MLALVRDKAVVRKQISFSLHCSPLQPRSAAGEIKTRGTKIQCVKLFNHRWLQKQGFEDWSRNKLIKERVRMVAVMWDDEVWLPPNITWEYFDHDDRFAQFSHLGLPIPMAFLLIIVRVFIQRQIFKPLGISLGLKALEPKSSRNDSVILGAQRDGITDSVAIAKKTGLQLRTVERWIRRNRRRITTLDKFCETGWRWEDD